MSYQNTSVHELAEATVNRAKSLGNRTKKIMRVVLRDPSARFGFVILMIFTFLGLFGPYLAPHDAIADTMRNPDGTTMTLTAPTTQAPLGTTSYGKDVLSQFLVGARPTFLVGLLGGIGTGVIGFLIGLTSGYFGGWVDEVLMRFTDLTFSLPFLPMALVILTFIQPTVSIIIIVLVIFLWKIPARIIRSEVLTVRERTFVKSARASGASHPRTMFVHVAPNVLPVGFLYTAYATAWAIGGQATLAFLGFGDPTTTSWGRMLEQVFVAGAMRVAWWWVVPPALAIMLVTTAVFLVGRALEEVINPEIATEREMEENQ